MAKELESRPNLLTDPRALLERVETARATSEMEQMARREITAGRDYREIENPGA
jgi:hypothetical protein